MAARSSSTRIRKCPSGSYEWVVRVRAADGVERQMRRRFATLGEARRALAQISTEVATGEHVDARGVVLGPYLTAWVDRKEAAGELRPSTARSYRSHIRTYIDPALGKIKIADLRPQHVDGMIDAIRAGRLGMGTPPGPATTRRIVATLASALGTAHKQRLISWNPARHAIVPKAQRPRVVPWSQTEAAAFLAATASERDAALWWVLVFTGMRRGEVCGLRWSDVDVERKVITVRQSVVVVGHQTQVGPPKSDNGFRTIDLDDITTGTLVEHRLRQDAERAEWGAAWANDDDRVFTREDGRGLHPQSVTTRFRRLSDAAGLRPTRLHDTRHLHAALMLAAGVPMGVVSKRLGHSSVSLTIDTYSSLLDGVGRSAAEAVAALFAAPAEGVVTTL